MKEKERGWWLQRSITALTKFCAADEAVQEARAMVSEHGWCPEHGEPAPKGCAHCLETLELLKDKRRALRERASTKATLLRVAKRAGISARQPIPRVSSRRNRPPSDGDALGPSVP